MPKNLYTSCISEPAPGVLIPFRANTFLCPLHILYTYYHINNDGPDGEFGIRTRVQTNSRLLKPCRVSFKRSRVRGQPSWKIALVFNSLCFISYENAGYFIQGHGAILSTCRGHDKNPRVVSRECRSRAQLEL